MRTLFPAPLCLLAALLAHAGLLHAQEPAAIPCRWTGVERVVAIGDIHGAYRELVQILREARLVDEKLNWSGGEAHLVQLGDVCDRGPESLKAFDLLRRLETEAAEAGGRVHALIGNHEAMLLVGDYRYLHPNDLDVFITPESRARREEFLKENPRIRRGAIPLGWVEHRAAFSPQGRYGSWITSHNVAIKINDSIFLHGGLSEKYSSMPLEKLNESMRAELRQPVGPGRVYPMLDDPLGPLWYRGLAELPEARLEKVVARALEQHEVVRQVIGHTVTPGDIRRRFGGRVVLIDCGMNPLYEGGRPAALELSQGRATAIYAGAKRP